MDTSLNTFLIGASGFLIMAILQQLIGKFFTSISDKEKAIKETQSQDMTTVKADLSSMLQRLTDIQQGVSVTNERTKTLFERVNENSSRLNKLADELLELHKNNKL